MTAFDDRKTAAEAKFTHDQEFQFKTMARRNSGAISMARTCLPVLWPAMIDAPEPQNGS